MLDNVSINSILTISYKAGQEIIEVYHSEFAVENKEDKSPLTLADKKSHEMIESELKKQYPDIPILSEEGKSIPYEERAKWEYFWLVDPLDGTKEFVKRNGEFTVNIALIHNGYPVLGVIYAPILDTVYVAKQNVGSYKLTDVKEHLNYKKDEQLLNVANKLPNVRNNEKKSVVASRSHMSKETEEYIEKIKNTFGEIDITSAGSSLKLCLVAEGAADVYPRFAPTMEWDTGAGQAIVEQAGGSVLNTETNERLQYNKENLLNPWFIVKKQDFNL